MPNYYVLNKKETKNAELETTPIWNFVNAQYLKKDNTELKNKFIKVIDKQFDWYQKPSILSTPKDRENHLIKTLGEPAYYANYEYRTAVWGLKIFDTDFVVYYSKKGFSVQIDKNSNAETALKIFKKILKDLKDAK